MTRGTDDLLADLAEAADAAAEIVMLGKERWDAERPLRLAGEAVVGRLGDIATKLPDEVTEATPEIPWRAGTRIRIAPQASRRPESSTASRAASSISTPTNTRRSGGPAALARSSESSARRQHHQANLRKALRRPVRA